MKINLGSGPVRGSNGWINIDREQGADLCLDLSRALPFDAGSIDQIYTSHFLEHLEYGSICSLLIECHRVLVSGGEISVCVPDARKFIDAYVAGDEEVVTLSDGRTLRVPRFLLAPSERIYPKALVETGSSIDWLNYIAYSNQEHRYLFDSVNLRAHLQKAGFVEVRLRDFDPALDHLYGKQASVYAVAAKA